MIATPVPAQSVDPATLSADFADAPKQQTPGRWHLTQADAAAAIYNDPGAKDDNLYLWGNAAVGITGTPLTANAHIGHSDGNPGLGPDATSVTPTGDYSNSSPGIDATWRKLTLGVSYIDTDISTRDAADVQPSFSKGQDGTGSIAGRTGVVSLTAAF